MLGEEIEWPESHLAKPGLQATPLFPRLQPGPWVSTHMHDVCTFVENQLTSCRSPSGLFIVFLLLHSGGLPSTTALEWLYNESGNQVIQVFRSPLPLQTNFLSVKAVWQACLALLRLSQLLDLC